MKIARTILEDGVRFQCQGSGKCCMSRGKYGYVYVTIEDRRRLAKHFRLPTQTFTKRYCDKTEGHFHLKEPEKDCFFLEGKRCGVYQARPTQCRTWPFWPEQMNARDWARDVVAFCPGIGKGRRYSPEEILEIMSEEKEVRGVQFRA